MDSKMPNTNFEKHIEINPIILHWTAIIILWIGIILCLSNGLIFDLKVIIGSILVILSTIINYFDYSKGAKFTLWVIIAGIVNIAEFLPIAYKIGLGTGKIFLGIELISLEIIIIHYNTNKKILRNYLRAFIQVDKNNEEITAQKQQRTNQFKRRFSNKTLDELKIISVDDRLVQSARIATKQLIEERYNRSDKS